MLMFSAGASALPWHALKAVTKAAQGSRPVAVESELKQITEKQFAEFRDRTWADAAAFTDRIEKNREEMDSVRASLAKSFRTKGRVEVYAVQCVERARHVVDNVTVSTTYRSFGAVLEVNNDVVPSSDTPPFDEYITRLSFRTSSGRWSRPRSIGGGNLDVFRLESRYHNPLFDADPNNLPRVFGAGDNDNAIVVPVGHGEDRAFQLRTSENSPGQGQRDRTISDIVCR